jgi:hypothetical protein
MRRVLIAATIVSGVFSAHAASANCARPVGYTSRALDAGIVIEPENFEGRGCPDPGGLLRQNVDTGEIVRVDTCVGADADAGATESRGFLDQCVGPGKYRYGFAKPYDCLASACSTDYFEEVVVTTPMTPGCRPYDKASKVPWGSSNTICSYSGRLVVVGIGFLAVVGLFVSAIFYAIVRVIQRRRASS